jgi:hypothetical protein
MLEDDKQVSLNNYVVIDPDPLGRSNELSQFEKDIILKFLSTLTLSELVECLPENTKNATLQDPKYELLKDISLGLKEDGVSLTPINSNFFYESVRVEIKYGENIICLILKISIDPENKKLSRERDALKSVPSLFSPQLIAYRNEQDSGIEFLLTTWENGESFETFGINDLEYNFGTFSAVLDGVHESDTTNITSFMDNFHENESITEALEEINEKEILMFEKLTDLTPQNLKDIFSKIKEEFLPQYKEDISVLCHGNLKKSNILYQSQYIKFINFEYSHSADLYYSLLRVVNNLYLFKNKSSIKNFLTKYHQHSNILGGISISEFLLKYEEKAKLNRILFFQELLSRILFHFAAYGAFTKKEKLEHYMNLYLNLKPTLETVFPEYIKSFDKLFFTVMPTVKTYDLEELKIIQEMYQ